MNGTSDRFWELLEPWYREGLMFCRRLAGDRDSGDDLYHDALLLALRKFPSLRDPGAFRAWLYRTIIRTFASTVRRPWWKRRVTLTAEVMDQLIGEDPGDVLAARRWLVRAFAAVSPEEQALVTLHELEQWSLAEIAALYGKSEGAIKLRLFRARKKMRQALVMSVSRDVSPERRAKLMTGEMKCAAAKPGLE